MTMGNDVETATSKARLAAIFLAFAWAYFLSALLRAVTATLAPVFRDELGIGAADLGLLAGAYFLGFALMQLPLGQALDRWGPRRVILGLLGVAALGCVGFALARDLPTLVLSRAAIGVGVSACLMAPLTCYRRLMSPAGQLRANSWMLMTGSLGMMASTLPVQWLLPSWGWRGLFWATAALLVVGWMVIAVAVPAHPTATDIGKSERVQGYRQILTHTMFIRMAPLGFFVYGGMIAVQALWAGPWLTRVAGWTASEAAGGLLLVNSSMLLTFLAWGAVLPRLARRGLSAPVLMTWGLPLSLLVLATLIVAGSASGALAWSLWCVSSTFVTLSQPAVGQAFPRSAAGRALSAFNLVIFSGVFLLQWGIGWLIDRLRQSGFDEPTAFRLAFAVFGVCCLASYLWFLLGRLHNTHNAGRP